MEIKQSGKIETLIIAAIIFVISVLSNFSKDLFVDQTGKFEIFGKFGLLLVVGLIWRWKYIGTVVSVFTFLAIVVILNSILLIKSISMAFFYLLIGLSIAFYLSTFSKTVKLYLNKVEQ